jgi:hypothetical protein
MIDKKELPAFRLNANQKNEFNSEYSNLFQAKKEVNIRKNESVDTVVFGDQKPAPIQPQVNKITKVSM